MSNESNLFYRTAKSLATAAAPLAARIKGQQLLSSKATLQVLEPYVVSQQTCEQIELPAYTSINGIPFHPNQVGNWSQPEQDDYVWRVPEIAGNPLHAITPSGNVALFGKKHIQDGIVSRMALFETRENDRTEDLVIALWPKAWVAYYDFLVHILPKLLRIEKAFGPGIWNEARLAYSRFNTPFEAEFLEWMNIPEEQVIDSRKEGKRILSREVIVSNTQWDLPSIPAVRMLRERFAPGHDTPLTKPGKRIYLTRGGTRNVANEAEILPILERYGFEVLEEKPRTVKEQIAIFGEAEMVVGPHGSAFANILWCRPGTRVFEWFHAGYHPNCFYFLSTLLGFPYQNIIAQSADNRYQHSQEHQYEPMTLQAADIEKGIELLLSSK